MRIISGKYKGRRLIAPKKLPVRPTTDMAKEALFNILANRFYFPETSVVDLFAGTGNISYEFASRGVKNITAVDANKSCCSYISNISAELEADIRVIKTDVFHYLKSTEKTADIIFADPPYGLEYDKFTEIILLVLEKERLKPEGVLIIEHAKQTDLSDKTRFVSARKYGGSVFSFFEP